MDVDRNLRGVVKAHCIVANIVCHPVLDVKHDVMCA